MGALQNVIAQVLQRLRDVTRSQRVALILGGALVAVSLIWMVQWAATPELVPLLDQDLSADELTLVTTGLDLMGKKYEQRGGRVYVEPTANRAALIAQLQQDQRLPANTAAGFSALIKESNPWISQTENNRRWTFALQEELKSVLKQFQGVHDASVFLNLGTESRAVFAKLPAQNSASVTLVMKSGAGVPRSLALAAARLVAGAVAGLDVRHVEVLDANGGPAIDWESEQDPSSTLTRLQVAHEQRYTELIRRQVPDAQARISVQVQLNATSSSTQTREPLQGPPRQEETTSERIARKRQSEQPGVQPNVGLAAGAGGMDESQERDTAKTEYETGVATKTEARPAGEVELVTAAVNLTSTYLKTVFQHTNPDADAPTDEQLEEVFQRERSRLLPQVARLIVPQDEANVALAWHYDAPLPKTPDVAERALDHSLDMMRQYGPQSGLGLLALISLGMMLRLARRSDEGESFGLELGLPREAIEAAKLAAADVASVTQRFVPGRGGAGGRGGAQRVVGTGGQIVDATTTEVEQAAATEGMLVAQEVDATTVQARKMLDQVSEMVADDAQTVASLVEQWVQKNDQYHEE